MTTEEGVLEAIYAVAGVTPKAPGNEQIFRGHPLAKEPAWAPWVFYLLWPGLVVAVKWMLEQ